MLPGRPIRLFIILTACLSAPVVAWAAPEEQQLDLSAYVGTGDSIYDVVSTEQSDVRTYLGVQGSATFERQGPRRTFSARVGGSARYFPATREFFSVDRSASVGVDARLGGRTRLRATQTVQYTPYRQFGLALFESETVGDLPIHNPDGAATFGQAFYDFGTLVELSRSLSQRTSISLDYVSRIGLTAAASENPMSQRAGISFRRVLGRHATLKLGTAYRFGRTGFESTALPTRAQDFDIGIDYSRPLSLSRRTTLSFSSGTALISRAATTTDPGEVGRQLVAIGAVTATQVLGRYWQAQLGLDRNLQYVDGFPDPFYATRVMSRVTGQIGRRLSLVGQADYSTGGGVGPAVVAQNFEGVRSEARLSYVVTRRWLLFAAHYVTHNRLSTETLEGLPPGVMVRPNQTSLQVGLNFRVD